MNKLYIAYGSNLCVEQMKIRCPEAKLIGTGTISDYNLLFRGSKTHAVATIEPEKGSHVPVGIWSISKNDELALDRYEGYPTLYHKESVSVAIEGKQHDAMVYIMDHRYQVGSPSKEYIDIIVQGYEYCGLDIEVLQHAINRSYLEKDELYTMEMQ